MTIFGRFWIMYTAILIICILGFAVDWMFFVLAAMILVAFITDYCTTDEFSERSIKQCRSAKDEHSDIDNMRG